MITASAWNSGKYCESGSGYGLRISATDRDTHFKRGIQSVVLRFPKIDEDIEVRITDSFWKQCREFRAKKIGLWLRSIGHVRWTRGQPPRFQLTKLSDGVLLVTPLQGGEA